MNIEIERKFIVKKMPELVESTIDIKQYYLMKDKSMVQRLRLFDNSKSIISFKQNTKNISRYEFEYEIPFEDANKIIEIMPHMLCIKKKRHIYYENNIMWEIDEFYDSNLDLIIAEVELDSEDQSIDIPKWITKEVTYEKKYYNFNLALNPYEKWKK